MIESPQGCIREEAVPCTSGIAGVSNGLKLSNYTSGHGDFETVVGLLGEERDRHVLALQGIGEEKVKRFSWTLERKDDVRSFICCYLLTFIFLYDSY